MAFRFRKSIKLAPGLSINLGKKSVSASVGTKGLRYTTGSAGRRVTAGLPGTGISYSKHLPKRQPSQNARLPLWSIALILSIVFVVAAWVLSR